MPATQPLGRSDLLVPRLGVGAMTWGEAHGLARLHPAKIAYGGAEGREEERGAWEASIAAGVTLFDTAAMYAGWGVGAAARRAFQRPSLDRHQVPGQPSSRPPCGPLPMTCRASSPTVWPGCDATMSTCTSTTSRSGG